MLLDDAALAEIEDGLVAATLRPDSWSDVVARIVDASGARGAAILPFRGRAPGVPVSPSCEAMIDAYFRDGWAERDHRMTGIPTALRHGLVVDQDISTPDFMRAAPFYADFLAKFGLRWFAGVLVDAGSDAWGLALQRTPEQGPFEAAEQAALRRLIAPLTRTAQLSRNMSEARLRGITDTLDALGVPGLLLDRTGDVIRANRLADPLIGRDFDLRRRRLSVRHDPRATAALRAHIEAAIWSPVRVDDPALEPVTIERWGQKPLIASAQPLRKVGLEYLDGARAILTIKDVDAASVPLASALRALYGLTSREIELCRALLCGHPIAHCAQLLGMSVATARTHLKHVLAKTNTSRQSALLMLLIRHVRA